jgi:hypothetical protein
MRHGPSGKRTLGYLEGHKQQDIVFAVTMVALAGCAHRTAYEQRQNSRYLHQRFIGFRVEVPGYRVREVVTRVEVIGANAPREVSCCCWERAIHPPKMSQQSG